MAQHNFNTHGAGDPPPVINDRTYNEFRSSTEMTFEEANREQVEAVRQFAAAPQLGPAAVDEYTGPRRAPQVGKPVEAGAIASNGPFRVSPSLDPRNVEAIDGWEEFKSDLHVAHNALSCAQVGLEQISNARSQAEKNQAWNDYQKLLIVGDAADKKLDSILQKFDKANTQLTKLAENLERELTQPLAASATGGFNVEIRERISKMKTDERNALVEKSVRSGDATIAQAVLGAPAILTGIHPDLHKILTRTWHEARSPDTVRKLAAVRKARDIVLERAQLVLPQTEKAMRGTFKKVKALREAESEAKKALLMQTADDPTA